MRVNGSRKARRVVAGLVSVGLLVPLAVFGGAGVARSSSAAQAQYGKTTICHRTHSKKKPYVKITVANASLKAHARHGDIIPAPAGGCPTTVATAASKQQGKGKQKGHQNSQKGHGKAKGRGK